MSSPDDPMRYTLPNGRHVGVPITRIPVGYLRWMANSGRDDDWRARDEMKRRGTSMPTVELTGHSIDRASQRLLTNWRQGRTDSNEGLYSWLAREAGAAWHDHERRNVPGPACVRNGVKFIFAVDGVWPTLKTVMTVQHKKKRRKECHEG